MAKKKSPALKLTPYPKDGSFGQLLDWHLTTWGTHPKCSRKTRSARWVIAKFAKLVCDAEDKDVDSAIATVNNWRFGRNVPSVEDEDRVQRIYFELFDDAKHLQDWKVDLQAALARGRAEKAAKSKKGKRAETTNIPPLRKPFLGRDHDVRKLVEALASTQPTPAIFVHGGPGYGKTELTKTVARDAAMVERFGDRRWFVPLEHCEAANAMQDAILRAMAIDPARGFPYALKMLRTHAALLVLDNLETPWEQSGKRGESEQQDVEQVLADLTGIPNVAILASFRGTGDVGNVEWHRYPVEVLPNTVASELFVLIAGEQVAGDPHLKNFIENALGGIPLAIELVARRAKGRASLAPLWREWNKIGTELADRSDAEKDRLTSLSRSIELSVRSPRMTKSALRLFSLLGVMPAGISFGDTDAVMGVSALPATERLCDIGLGLDRDERLDLLPPIRDYARRYYPSDDRDQDKLSHRFLDLVSELSPLVHTAQAQIARRRLHEEFLNIETALRHAVSQGKRVDIADSLDRFGSLAFDTGRPTRLFSDLAGNQLTNDPENQALCFRIAGDLARARSEFDAAMDAYIQAQRIYDRIDDRRGFATCQQSIADMAVFRADYELAEQSCQLVAPFWREIDDVIGQAHCIKTWGEIALFKAKYSDARTHHTQARALYEKEGDLRGIACCLLTLGEIELLCGNHALARSHYDDALRRFQKLDYLLGQANCWYGLGLTAFDLGDFLVAQSRCAKALAIYEEVGNAIGEANCALSLGDLAIALEEYGHAETYFQNALTRFRIIGRVFLSEGNCLSGLGVVAMQQGRLDHAKELFSGAMAQYEVCDNAFSKAACLTNIGDLACLRSNHDEARAAYSKAEALYREAGNFPQAERCRLKLATL